MTAAAAATMDERALTGKAAAQDASIGFLPALGSSELVADDDSSSSEGKEGKEGRAVSEEDEEGDEEVPSSPPKLRRTRNLNLFDREIGSGWKDGSVEGRDDRDEDAKSKESGGMIVVSAVVVEDESTLSDEEEYERFNENGDENDEDRHEEYEEEFVPPATVVVPALLDARSIYSADTVAIPLTSSSTGTGTVASSSSTSTLAVPTTVSVQSTSTSSTQSNECAICFHSIPFANRVILPCCGGSNVEQRSSTRFCTGCIAALADRAGMSTATSTTGNSTPSGNTSTEEKLLECPRCRDILLLIKPTGTGPSSGNSNIGNTVLRRAPLASIVSFSVRSDIANLLPLLVLGHTHHPGWLPVEFLRTLFGGGDNESREEIRKWIRWGLIDEVVEGDVYAVPVERQKVIREALPGLTELSFRRRDANGGGDNEGVGADNGNGNEGHGEDEPSTHHTGGGDGGADANDRANDAAANDGGDAGDLGLLHVVAFILAWVVRRLSRPAMMGAVAWHQARSAFTCLLRRRYVRSVCLGNDAVTSLILLTGVMPDERREEPLLTWQRVGLAGLNMAIATLVTMVVGTVVTFAVTVRCVVKISSGVLWNQPIPRWVLTTALLAGHAIAGRDDHSIWKYLILYSASLFVPRKYRLANIAYTLWLVERFGLWVFSASAQEQIRCALLNGAVELLKCSLSTCVCVYVGIV